ncbi:hypothetical protein [Streptomyces sp. ST2-7A]|uniref:hypothetical protein n=1 Tax=Streptomyces sp. ST2-7A TaxID=2907214 RepID=UPI001F33FA70|nr:hypothetical protein [Streptomyces sp. ST2-7A]MCE7079819.1 hypothetical protein [Streptomyces sp. ST2-7A]
MTQAAERSPAPRTPHPSKERNPPPTPSFFFNGHVPRRRRAVIAVSALVGFALTVVWSAHFVDKTIGGTVADGLLGHPAAETPIAGVTAGLVFALVTGIAGTFTACNVAVFGALAPLTGRSSTARGRMTAALRPLGVLTAGAVAVSAVYGVVVALVGSGMPQFQENVTTGGALVLSGRLIQAMVVYGIIGLIMIHLGLVALGYARDPLARLTERFPDAPMVFMGALIGGFLIGRPFPLFRHLFRDAAESHNVLYGAFAFALQTVGNLLIMGVLFLVVVGVFGKRLHGWLTARPTRSSSLMAAGFLSAGVFMVLYWNVRLLSRVDLIWYPVAPWV